MVHQSLDLLTIGVGATVATSHVYTAALGFSVGKNARGVNYLFAFGMLAAAWFALWTAVLYSGLAQAYPILWGVPQLLSGYGGPALFLFTVSVMFPRRKLPRAAYLALLGGVFGTLVSLRVITDPAGAALVGAEITAGTTVSDPVLRLLYRAHMTQIIAFAVLTLGVLVRATWKGEPPEVRKQALAVLLGLVATIGGVVFSSVLPVLTGWVGAARLGPLFTIPLALVTYRTLVSSRALKAQLEAKVDTLQRYVPETLSRRESRLTAGPALKSEEADVTVLFCDIRGFTSLSERLPPTEVVALLNRYLAEMTAAARAHHGVVDKFIGDAVLVVFGIDEAAGESHARDGLSCAAEMQRRVATLNRWCEDRGLPELRIGVGLASGRVVHGSIGTLDRMEYTVIGDPVNAASRVESLTKTYDVGILATEATIDRLPATQRQGLRYLGVHQLRGRQAVTPLWAADGWAEPRALSQDRHAPAAPARGSVPDLSHA